MKSLGQGAARLCGQRLPVQGKMSRGDLLRGVALTDTLPVLSATS